MLDRDHHIHLIPSGRILMMSLEHNPIKKIETERFELECILKLSVEGFPHPLEDVIRLTFAAAKLPGQQMMTELAFVQNHIIKSVFDKGLAGELCGPGQDDSAIHECGITISSEIKAQMLVSKPLKEVLERYGALPESIAFPK